MPVPWLAIMAGSQAAKGLYDWYSAGKQKKKSQSNLKGLTRGYLQKSPEEQQFLSMLQGRIEKGALPVRAMMQDVSADIGEHGQVARQKALGFAASRGLENTGVAASMAGKADANTIQAIARQARAIAIQNEMTKTDAEREMGQYGMGRSDLVRQLATLKYQGQEGIADRYTGQMSDAMGGLTSAVGTYAGGKAGINEDDLFNALKDLSPEQRVAILQLLGM